MIKQGKSVRLRVPPDAIVKWATIVSAVASVAGLVIKFV
jgi:hypothetical protein